MNNSATRVGVINTAHTEKRWKAAMWAVSAVLVAVGGGFVTLIITAIMAVAS